MGGLGDELAAELVSVPTGDEHLVAHDGIAREAYDALDVGAAGGDAAGDAGDGAGAERLAEHRHVVALRPPAGPSGRHRLDLDGDPERRGALLEALTRQRLLVAQADEQAQDEAVADDDLLQVEDAGAVLGEDPAQGRGQAGAVAAGDGDEEGGGIIHSRPSLPQRGGEIARAGEVGR